MLSRLDHHPRHHGRALLGAFAAASLLVAALAASPAGPTSGPLRPVADSQRTIKISGLALCAGTLKTPTPCASVSLSGPGYDGVPVVPNAFLGFDYGRFTFDNVSVPNDFSDVTYIVRASASTASAGISADEDCSRTITFKGATVIGDTYAIDLSFGPWGPGHLCSASGP